MTAARISTLISSPIVLAPAKLNFGLRVTGRRADGYHLLESLFVPIDLSDRISLRFGAIGPAREVGEVGEAGEGGEVEIDFEMTCDEALTAGLALTEPSENLAVRAARRYFELAELSGSLSIRLEKSIPVGAGLGGGSSDAGAVLRALDRQWPGLLSRDTLVELATGLGADVPFFLAPEPSVIRGIGEQVSAFPNLPGYWLLLANPGVSLATAEVFEIFAREASALTVARSRSTMRALDRLASDARSSDSVSKVLQKVVEKVVEKSFDSGLLENDLESVATSQCPQVGELKERLGGLGARWTGMSGSGATVYGIFSDEASARSALERAKFESPIWACVTQTRCGSKP